MNIDSYHLKRKRTKKDIYFSYSNIVSCILCHNFDMIISRKGVWSEDFVLKIIHVKYDEDLETKWGIT